MFEIAVQRVFSAAHAIRLYDGSLEPVHGHNWPVEVTVAAEQLDEIEVVMDFHLLETLVDGLMKRVHNRHLNDVPPFGSVAGTVNPSAERVAWWIGTEVAKGLPANVKLVSVRVGEAAGCFATYRP